MYKVLSVYDNTAELEELDRGTSQRNKLKKWIQDRNLLRQKTGPRAIIKPINLERMINRNKL